MPIRRLEEVNICSIKMLMFFQFLECLMDGGGAVFFSS